MKIMKLLENVAVKKMVNYADLEIEGIASDSREVSEKTLFICLKGEKCDGHEYVSDAQAHGAVALVVSEVVESDLPQFLVENTRIALALIAGNFYGHPAEKMKLLTVVGTNGKTSTVEILSDIFLSAGHPSATIGTLGYKIGRDRRTGMLTTPDPIDLHRHLHEMCEQGVEYVFLEASAHAIHYDKLAGIRANATIFTNITQDHLDFFHTMEEYAETKLSYFSLENTSLCIVNSDDPYGRKLLSTHKIPTISYGIENPADVFAINIREETEGLAFTINAFDKIEEIVTPLHGRFNVYNVMAAVAASMYFGIGLPCIAKALERMPIVPGRYQGYNIRNRRIIVDFAHTPDGLANLLSDVRRAAKGRVITVFGCGGNRDRSKRPIMGGIAAKYSDLLILTDDNPRDEEERAIVEEIRGGIPTGMPCEVVLEREKAIHRAFDSSREGDTIVIAGKGHEEYIEIKGKKLPYSDSKVLEKLYR